MVMHLREFTSHRRNAVKTPLKPEPIRFGQQWCFYNININYIWGENCMKKLRITNPQITSYGGIANMLSILESYSETYSWIYSNFVQMIYYQNKDGDYLHNMTGSLYELETGLKYLPLYTIFTLDL